MDEGLRYALAHGASVELSAPAGIARGKLVEVGDRVLTVELVKTDNGPTPIRATDSCAVTVFCGIGMLAFESVVRETRTDDGRIVVAIDDAKAIQAPQRRRFWRTPCRRSSRVSLSNAQQHACQGALLDISPDGLACLVDRRDVSEVAEGSIWQVSFRLVDGFAPMSVTASLRSSSFASDETKQILRFQFTFGDEGPCTRDDIAAAIARASK